DPRIAPTRGAEPLESDRCLRASSGTRRSMERRVTVQIPAFLAGLQLTARYPSYLGHPDEPLVPGPDTIAIPEGSAILTSGAASVPLTTAAWRHGGRSTGLEVNGVKFAGRLEPTGSGVWALELGTADGSPVEGEAPELRLRVIPDSAPVVTLPVPGRDT